MRKDAIGGYALRPFVAGKFARSRAVRMEFRLISHRHKCIFVHVPKTGGTSIEDAFVSELGLSFEERGQLLIGANPGNQGPRRISHFTAVELLESGHITRKLFESYFKFGFVRDPWDRAVSTYKYLRIGGEFKRFACDILPNSLSKSAYFGYFVRPQHAFLYDRNGECLVDFVGRFERLEQDFEIVSDRLELDATLPHKNQHRSPHIPVKSRLRQAAFGIAALNLSHVMGAFGTKEIRKRPRDYFDAESAAFVGEFYKDDVNTFGYRF